MKNWTNRMCDLDLAPCVACGRRYGHLEDCRLKALHLQLDEMIREHGLNITFSKTTSLLPAQQEPPQSRDKHE